MVTIKLGSSPMVFAPNVFRFLLAMYDGGDRVNAVKILRAGWGLSASTARAVLSRKIDYRISGDDVIFQAAKK